MKRFLKSAGLPIGVFALAIGSAFATNAMKNTLSVEPGYQRIDSQGLECDDPEVMCDSQGTVTCTWKDASNITHNLYGKRFNEALNKTVCTLPLYKIQTP
ncbi:MULTISPECIES: DUF6520 family protein [Myroides]|uniref:DUF6520 family protein n=1 Tax=Myroides TaxID=76831 RepID=UPI00132194DB|nr:MULTISPECIES: DUF6520 family protein [Myroides]MDM1094910.1 hypothetical protein [Myroides odoratimimus]MDM1444433.1 hypothetical protein [Myroides odoratimimus]MVX36204.1 hypothetical protein [Myroides sp. LoEW2-1]